MDKIIVSLVILFVVVSLYKELFRPVATFVIAIVVLLLFRILSPKDVLAGFANEQIAVIFLLLVLSDVIKKTGALDISMKKIFKPGLSYPSFMTRMFGSVSFTSAWVNNTPLVAIMIPHIYQWARKCKISPSKVLLPLSYAAILGGTVTLVGTSTNLVVNSLTVEAHLPPLKMFDFTLIGIPLVILGGLFLLVAGHKLLPERHDLLSGFSEKSREYITETVVPAGSPLIGKNIEEANLRNLRGLFLVEIIRDGRQIVPVSPREIIRQSDELIFAGEVNTIIDLVKDPSILSLPQFSNLHPQENITIVDVVISTNSVMNGMSVKNTNFRGKYDAAIVAISRNGEKLSGKIGDTLLQAGDLLLLVVGKDFYQRTEGVQDFYIISNVRELNHINSKKVWLILLFTLAVFVLSGIGIISLFFGLLILLSIFAFFKFVKLKEVKENLDLQLLLMLVLSLALGKAIELSGTANVLANMMISVTQSLHSPVIILLGLFLITLILTNVITHAAAAAVIFPIAVAAAVQLGLDTKPFILAVAYAASCGFMTPFSYQTNLMVYGPGGYKFSDYLHIGFWMTLISVVVCVGGLGLVYGLF
ncbi:MAG: potassium transporter TrkA [Bacteroidetes bacterium RIFCSPLOWO2_02_FULL_36_8]|nr:MAG: potassium transporter TrkA [Bacteroidetes bacterium RIFCSPLOWO2_02_FULL_36_8]OFY70967.1 MAG: potassium transporter TrkA [Bacteroidetes bacterium RIFCSPLOWO2_12_FULL_37_12]